MKLQRTYVPDGRALPEVLAATLTDKADVEGAVRRAAALLLSPERFGTFQPDSDLAAALDELQSQPSDVLKRELSKGFSRNAVVLEVDGAEADLTLLDLPGGVSGNDHKGLRRGCKPVSLRELERRSAVLRVPAHACTPSCQEHARPRAQASSTRERATRRSGWWRR